MNYSELHDKNLQSKGFDSRISSIEGQCVNHYVVEPSVIAIIFKWILVYAFVEFAEFIDSAS